MLMNKFTLKDSKGPWKGGVDLCIDGKPFLNINKYNIVSLTTEFITDCWGTSDVTLGEVYIDGETNGPRIEFWNDDGKNALRQVLKLDSFENHKKQYLAQLRKAKEVLDEVACAQQAP